MKKIGGFFELEIVKGSSLYHDEAIGLSTGRACLNLLLTNTSFSKVYVPYYCCNALFEPLELNNIDYEFYNINENFEIIDQIKLKKTEAIIYCNFFGLKTDYINQLIELYKEQLIIDNSHSFFSKGFNINASFTTARKYFGIPDGAFLYMPKILDLSFLKRNETVSIDHNLHSLILLQDQAFKEFQDYESSLNSEIKKISILSEKILKTIDYKEVRKRRNENFDFYRTEFNNYNILEIKDNISDCFCYPLLLEKPIERQKLYDEKIFIPYYWLDVINRFDSNNYSLECKFSVNILPLPIDHRYTVEDLKRVVNTIKSIINGK